MPQSVRVRVPAKINLSLGVGARRRDGFHTLATVYHAVSLFDHVTVTDRQDGKGLRIAVAGRDAELIPTDGRNLAWRAATLAAEALDRPADLTVTIDKQIPAAGGMAGGSADAAGVLVACGQLWDAGAADVDVAELAARIGSDVPFGLIGGTAVGMGRGEVVSSAISRGTFHWVLALSDAALATPLVYQAFDSLHVDRPVPAPHVDQHVLWAVRAGDAAALGRALTNDLQQAALSLMPSLGLLLELGPEHGALGAIVSGSGPTCAFLVPDEDTAMELAVALSASGLCRAVRRAEGPVPGATVMNGAVS